ncbi:MAG: hypothetical protein ACWGPR_11545 [Candidatus Deferrimicrobiaceae bacterium]
MNWEDEKTPRVGVDEPPTIVMAPMPFTSFGAVADVFLAEALELGQPRSWRVGDAAQQQHRQRQLIERYTAAVDSGRVQDPKTGALYAELCAAAWLRFADFERLKPRR